MQPFSEEALSVAIDLHAAFHGLKPLPYKSESIVPPKFITQIPLIDVFERLHRVKADRWQKDFCRRLQEATEQQDIQGTRAIIHAQSQIGKSVIMAQIFPIWLLGHQPTYRIALLTYNKTNSQKHSDVAISYMQSSVYKDMFRNRDSWIPSIASKSKWSTFGRMQMNDGQPSFNPVGLQSGFTGNGAECVLVDDPYKDLQEALSPVIMPKIESKWKDLTLPRINEHTNVFGMFHRYHHEDFAGYLLKTGTFDYWRYASQCDGDFLDKNTGRVFTDPLGREVGEYLSERYGENHYKEAKQYPQLWASQYQGKPSADVGAFFDTNLLQVIEGELLRQKAQEVVYWVRSWDNAATDEAGAYSVGSKVGILPNRDLLITDLQRKQVNTAKRLNLQLETAKSDGKSVPVRIPQDPGSAGKDTATTTVTMLAKEGFECIAEVVTGTKEVRAHSLSQKVNAGKVFLAKGKWNKDLIDEFEKFPLSKYKDIVDATADGERHLEELMTKGNVITYFDDDRTLVTWDAFAAKYGRRIPKHWELYVALQYNANASIPSGIAIVARAAANARIGDRLFLIGCQKQYGASFETLVTWLETFLESIVEKDNKNRLPNIRLVINKDAQSQLPVLRRKLKLGVTVFDGTPTDGIPETNWYMKPRLTKKHPFNPGQVDTGFYWLCPKIQIENPVNEYGLISARQEAKSWTYTEKNEPQQFGGIVLNAVRMLAYEFRTNATPLTKQEQFFDHLSKVSPELMPNSEIVPTAEFELARTIARREWEGQQDTDFIDTDYNRHVRSQEEEGEFELL